MSIAENIIEINERISAAAKKSNRTAQDVTLIGVTKTIDTENIKKMLDCGVMNIGENRVQELVAKHDVLKHYTHLGNLPKWHMIGHLQKNKIKYILDKVGLIHSVDTLELAVMINNACEKMGIKADFLLEINIAQESTKFGISHKDIGFTLENISKLSHIALKGLMCVPPYVENGEDNRRYFDKMRKLLLDINENCLYYTNLSELSMGMTSDYDVAIEEGATMVRVGSGIFGRRL